MLDISLFGSGVGLVMLGWIAGMIVGVAFKVISSLGDA